MEIIAIMRIISLFLDVISYGIYALSIGLVICITAVLFALIVSVAAIIRHIKKKNSG